MGLKGKLQVVVIFFILLSYGVLVEGHDLILGLELLLAEGVH